MDNPITRAEFTAFKETCSAEHRNLEAEDKRQNERLKELEAKTGKILDLATSVQSLADSVERMLNELENQGKRINTLESRDGDAWRKFKWLFVASAVSLLAGFLFGKLFGG